MRYCRKTSTIKKSLLYLRTLFYFFHWRLCLRRPSSSSSWLLQMNANSTTRTNTMLNQVWTEVSEAMDQMFQMESITKEKLMALYKSVESATANVGCALLRCIVVTSAVTWAVKSVMIWSSKQGTIGRQRRQTLLQTLRRHVTPMRSSSVVSFISIWGSISRSGLPN